MQDILGRNAVRSILPPVARPSPLNRRTMWAFLFLGAVVWALAQSGLFQRDLINEGGWTLALRFIGASLHPDLSPQFLRLTLDATLTTLAFAVAGTFLSLSFGVVGGILASEVWWESLLPNRGRWRRLRSYRGPWLLVRSFLAVLRAIHEIIWGLFFVNIIGLDPLTAILAIAVPFGSVIAKVFSEVLDETPRQSYMALQNSGVSPLPAFAYTLLPQAFRDWLSYGFYRFECAIRAAAVLGIIGAGGLGYEIFLSLQTLKYEQIWTLFFALFLLNGLADYWSALLRRRLGSAVSCKGGACLDLEVIKGASRQPVGQPGDRVTRVSLITAALLVPFSFWYVSPDFSKLFSPRTMQHLRDVGHLALPPDFGALAFWAWAELSATTLAMSLLAVAGAGVFGLILSFPAAHNFLLPGGVMNPGGGGKARGWLAAVALILARGILLISRSIPPPVWALVLLYVLFPGILPGAVALGLYTLGVLGRLTAEVIENLDQRPLLALKAQGAGSSHLFAYGALPPTIPRFIGYLLYRWEEAIRATVVIGLVGAGGLGRVLTDRLSSFDYHGVLTILIVFVGIIFLVDMISTTARRSFR